MEQVHFSLLKLSPRTNWMKYPFFTMNMVLNSLEAAKIVLGITLPGLNCSKLMPSLVYKTSHFQTYCLQELSFILLKNMMSFCTAKALHIFSATKYQHTLMTILLS